MSDASMSTYNITAFKTLRDIVSDASMSTYNITAFKTLRDIVSDASMSTYNITAFKTRINCFVHVLLMLCLGRWLTYYKLFNLKQFYHSYVVIKWGDLVKSADRNHNHAICTLMCYFYFSHLSLG